MKVEHSKTNNNRLSAIAYHRQRRNRVFTVYLIDRVPNRALQPLAKWVGVMGADGAECGECQEQEAGAWLGKAKLQVCNWVANTNSCTATHRTKIINGENLGRVASSFKARGLCRP